MAGKLLEIEEVARKTLVPLGMAHRNGIYRCLGCMDCTKYREAGERLALPKCSNTDKQAWFFLAHDRTHHACAERMIIIHGGKKWETEADELWEPGYLLNLQDENNELSGNFVVVSDGIIGINGKDQFCFVVEKTSRHMPELPVYIVFPRESGRKTVTLPEFMEANSEDLQSLGLLLCRFLHAESVVANSNPSPLLEAIMAIVSDDRAKLRKPIDQIIRDLGDVEPSVLTDAFLLAVLKFT